MFYRDDQLTAILHLGGSDPMRDTCAITLELNTFNDNMLETNTSVMRALATLSNYRKIIVLVFNSVGHAQHFFSGENLIAIDDALAWSLGPAKRCDNDSIFNFYGIQDEGWSHDEVGEYVKRISSVEDRLPKCELYLKFYPQKFCSEELFDKRYEHETLFVWRAMWDQEDYSHGLGGRFVGDSMQHLML